jgi:ribosomal protein L37AE/L43A
MVKHESATEIPVPCPVCRSVRYLVKHHHDIWIQCARCGKKGAHADKLKDAIRLWNKADGEKS